MSKQRAPARSPEQAPAPASSPEIVAPEGPSQEAPEIVDPWETPTLAAAGAPDPESPAGIADTLVRATRGEPVPPEQVEAARGAVGSLDSEGTAVVLDRLQQEGLLDQVVERGILTEDGESEMLDRVDALIPVSLLICDPLAEGLVNEQVTWAEEAYANARLQFSVVDRQRLPREQAAAILAPGTPGAADINPEGGPGVTPGQEAEALLAEAWERYGDAGVSHAVFVPAMMDESIGGAAFNSGTYQTAQPGCLSVAGSNPSTLGHEVGHLLGLPHIEDDPVEQARGPSGQEQQGNMMATNPSRGFRLSPTQVERIKRSLRARLIPRSVEPGHTPRPDIPPSWRGDARSRPTAE